MNGATTTLGIRDLLRATADALTHAGLPDSRWEAEMLVAHVLNCTRADLYREALFPNSTQQAALTKLVRRRSEREPLQHLLGTQEFWGLEFRVTPDVLVPRPETEFLIEAVLERFPERAAPLTLVDLGTGSGCLAITLSTLYPNARMLATDLSAAALRIARLNASAHGVAGRIEFLEGDLFEPLTRPGGDGFEICPHPADLLLSNPPYVPTSEIDRLQPEVRLYEPRRALDGGSDGLDYYRRILPRAISLLRPGGFLCLEVGIDQAESVCTLAERSGWRLDQIVRDLQKIQRVIIFTKPEPPIHG